ncbi:MAG: hypothetical protein IJI60_01170 [Bacilli bacterium]|nr:hypothetical protein [Bacilli bacterium]
MEENNQVKQSEERISQNNRRNTFIFVLAALLIVGLSVACGWFANSYFAGSHESTDKNSNNGTDGEIVEKTESKEWVSLGTDISKVEDVYEKVSQFIYKKNRPNGGLSFGVDEHNQNEMISFLASCLSVSDLDDTTSIFDYGTKGFLSYEKAQAILAKYFGKKIIIDTNYDSGLPNANGIAYFDKDKNAYVVNFYPHGRISGPETKIILRQVVEALESSDEIKIIEKAIYVSSKYENGMENYEIYADPGEKISIERISDSTENISNYTITVSDYLDKAATITSYYHKAEDGTYYFVSSEITN